jgi:streptogramin lyase
MRSPYYLDEPFRRLNDRAGQAGIRLLLAICILASITGAATAQTATFSGSQSAIPTSSLNNPLGVAVDQNGSIYIADAGNKRILKETLSGGVFTESIVATESSAVDGVAVDQNGNVYFLSLTGGTVFKTVPGASGYTVDTIPTSGLNSPTGIAVDASGSIYIADGTGGGRLLKETLSGDSFTESTIGSGLEQPVDIAIDSKGSIYTLERTQTVSDIVVETLSNGSYVQSRLVPVNHSFNPGGIAVDAKGDIFVTDQCRAAGDGLRQLLHCIRSPYQQT